jgi:hypothetical protein
LKIPPEFKMENFLSIFIGLDFLSLKVNFFLVKLTGNFTGKKVI